MARQGEHGITWTDESWNAIRGCSRVSEGCRRCYAERTAGRFSGPGMPYEGLVKMHGVAHDDKDGRVLKREARWTGDVRFVPKHLKDPLKWQTPRRVFVNSMSDLFHEGVPDEWIDSIFAVMALAGRHTFQILTKRPERMVEYMNRLSHSIQPLADAAGALGHTFDFDGRPLLPWPIRNIWIGVSVEDQANAEKRIPLLLVTPANVRWISYEPALGPLDLTCIMLPTKGVTAKKQQRGDQLNALTGEVISRRSGCVAEELPGLDWIVAGGESGPNARPAHPDWFRLVRDHCAAADVAFHFKQWGEWAPQTEIRETDLPLMLHTEHRRFEDGLGIFKVGKLAAGRMLEGRTWNQYPDQPKVREPRACSCPRTLISRLSP